MKSSSRKVLSPDHHNIENLPTVATSLPVISSHSITIIHGAIYNRSERAECGISGAEQSGRWARVRRQLPFQHLSCASLLLARWLRAFGVIVRVHGTIFGDVSFLIAFVALGLLALRCYVTELLALFALTLRTFTLLVAEFEALVTFDLTFGRKVFREVTFGSAVPALDLACISFLRTLRCFVARHVAIPATVFAPHLLCPVGRTFEADELGRVELGRITDFDVGIL